MEKLEKIAPVLYCSPKYLLKKILGTFWGQTKS